MKDLKTFSNVEEAFSNECSAIIKYLIYADIATAEGDSESAELFEKMARNETEHAKLWFKQLNSTDTDTLSNLKKSASDENDEWKEVYPNNSITAKEEGYEEIATLFERVASIECDHERKFLERAMVLENGGKEFVKISDNNNKYCIFCGYNTDEDINICPVCGGVDTFE